MLLRVLDGFRGVLINLEVSEKLWSALQGSGRLLRAQEGFIELWRTLEGFGVALAGFKELRRFLDIYG